MISSYISKMSSLFPEPNKNYHNRLHRTKFIRLEKVFYTIIAVVNLFSGIISTLKLIKKTLSLVLFSLFTILLD